MLAVKVAVLLNAQLKLSVMALFLYQAGAWNKNHGIRIDHFLLSPSCADMLVDCQADRDCRAKEKPSDHVPVWVELDI